MDRSALLAAYDDQLRTDAEAVGAIAVSRLGPLSLITFAGGRGLVTYRQLPGSVPALVSDAVAHFRADPGVDQVEWKTRGHDQAPGLRKALLEQGFQPGEPESIMLGELRMLDVEVALPAGVQLRQVSSERDVRAMTAMQDAVFGEPVSEHRARAAMDGLARGGGMQLWVAEAGGRIIGAGRLEPVAGSEFAGIWGGATEPGWRGKGVYRAITAARARSALALGKTLAHSDSTEHSRPILERAGLVKVSTTTPYHWRR